MPTPIATPAADRGMTLDPDGTPVLIVDHWVWCFSTPQGIDLCTSTRDVCMGYSSNMGGGCVPAAQMTCFNTRPADATRDIGWCFRAVASCRAMLDVLLARPDHDPVTYGCITFRRDAR